MLAEKLFEGNDFSGAWNFGPDNNEAKTVKVIADLMAQYWGPGAGWKTDQGAYQHEAQSLNLDSSKARNKLKWQSALELDTSLEMTVSWYKAFLEKQDMIKFTLSQIEDYVVKRKS